MYLCSVVALFDCVYLGCSLTYLHMLACFLPKLYFSVFLNVCARLCSLWQYRVHGRTYDRGSLRIMNHSVNTTVARLEVDYRLNLRLMITTTACSMSVQHLLIVT